MMTCYNLHLATIPLDSNGGVYGAASRHIYLRRGAPKKNSNLGQASLIT